MLAFKGSKVLISEMSVIGLFNAIAAIALDSWSRLFLLKKRYWC